MKKATKGAGAAAVLAIAGTTGYLGVENADLQNAVAINGTNEQVLTKMINEQRITIAELEAKARACK